MHGLSFAELAGLHPFHFAVDTRMLVVQQGRHLHTIAGNAVGSSFADRFTLLFPVVASDWESIRSHPEATFLLRVMGSDARLQGFFWPDDALHLLFFFGTPLAPEASARAAPTFSGGTGEEPRDTGQSRLRLLSKVFMSVSDPILIEDLAGNVVEMNDEAVRAYGWQRSELLGRPLKILLPPKHHALSDTLLRKCRNGKDINNIEGERWTRDGRIIPVLLTMTLLRDEDERPAAIVTIAKDISVRKQKELELEKQRQDLENQVAQRTTQLQSAKESVEQANKELQKVQERLSIALDSAQIGIWEFDARSKKETWDDRMYELFGIDKATASDPHSEFARRVLPEDLVKLQEEIRLTMRGEIDYDTVYRVRWPDGSLRYIKGSGLVIRDSDGLPLKVIGANYDITELKTYESNLHIAKEAAEAASVAKSDFLARMSHEIRTPMNAVIGMTHLALQTELTARQRDYLEKAHSSAISLLDIINDILDFSKIEAGRMELESIEFSIDEILEQLSTLFSMKAAEKGLELLFHVHPEVPAYLCGDPLRLRQILINLTGNALKFSEAGEIVVSISLLETHETAVRLEFSVSDTGIGMTKEQLGKLFTSFSQADGTTTRKYGGTGLGLVICKRLVDLMQGEIRVASCPGQGSSFSFTAVFAASPRADQVKYTIPEWFPSVRTLIVDDSAVSRRILGYALESFGIPFDAVPSGEEALVEVAVAEEPYRLILMDMELTGMDGIAASRKILSQTSDEVSPKIIMVTAYGQERVAKAATAAGIHGFLVKPVSKAALIDAILECFGFTPVRHTSVRAEGGTLRQNQYLRGKNVLLVEDNAINQQVATEFLEQAGITVSLAENGTLGVAMALSRQYDMIFMDIQMPEMDGYTAARQIRAADTLTPIVAMTANAMAGDREKSLAAGMNDHLTKPLEPSAILQILTKWLTGTDGTELQVIKPAGDHPSENGDTRLMAIPGIDMLTGLTRVNNNRLLYRQLLTKFMEEHEADAEKAADCLDSGDSPTALRLVHTLKGIAGSIGASGLQDLAAKLEQSLRQEKKANHQRLLAELNLQLRTLGRYIAAALAPAQASPPPPDVRQAGSSSQLLALLDNLAPHIRKGKPKPAAEALGQLAEFVWPKQYRGDVTSLETAVKKYQFKGAEACLDTLVERLRKDCGG